MGYQKFYSKIIEVYRYINKANLKQNISNWLYQQKNLNVLIFLALIFLHNYLYRF